MIHNTKKSNFRCKIIWHLIHVGVLQTLYCDLYSLSARKIRWTANPTTTTNAIRSTATVVNNNFSSRVLFKKEKMCLYVVIINTKNNIIFKYLIDISKYSYLLAQAEAVNVI